MGGEKLKNGGEKKYIPRRRRDRLEDSGEEYGLQDGRRLPEHPIPRLDTCHHVLDQVRCRAQDHQLHDQCLEVIQRHRQQAVDDPVSHAP